MIPQPDSVPWVAGLLRASLHVALLTPLLLGALRLAGNRITPALRHALWLILLLRLALPWVPAGPLSPLGLPGMPRALPENPAAPQAVAPPVRPRTVHPIPGTAPTPASESRRDVIPAPAPGNPARREQPVALATPHAPPQRTTPTLPRTTVPQPPSTTVPRTTDLLLALWAAVSLTLATRWAALAWTLRRRLARTAHPVGPHAADILEATRLELGLRFRVPMLETPEVPGPAIFGIWRPCILVPPGFLESCPDASLRHVLLHELAHVRRRDALIHAAASLLAAVHWFNPAAWILRRELAMEREMAADALALSVQGESGAKAYGATILRVLEHWATRRLRPVVLGMLQDPDRLQHRIRAIVSYRRRGRLPRALLAVAASVLTATLALTDASPGNAEPRRPLLPAPLSPATSPVLDLDFAGLAALRNHPDLPALGPILRLPESHTLGGSVARRLSSLLTVPLGIDAPEGTERAADWNHLLSLLFSNECALHISATATGTLTAPDAKPDWAVAARLDPGAREAVVSTVRRLASTSLRNAHLHSEVAGPWTLLHSGTGARTALRGRLDPMGAGPLLAGGSIARATVDLSRVVAWLAPTALPPVPFERWPMAEGTLEPHRGRLRILARLRHDADIDLNLEPWELPTTLLREPLVSFSAFQGADRWQSRLPFPPGTPKTEWPRQAFLWSLAGGPWEQYLAAPTPNPGGWVDRLTQAGAEAWLTLLGWPSHPARLEHEPATRQTSLLGLPYFDPFIAVVDQTNRPVVYAGLFPNRPGSLAGPPAPAALLAQVEGRTNLVRYDWETTGRELPAPDSTTPRRLGRLAQLRDLAQFSRFLGGTTTRRGNPAGPHGEILIPGSAWIEAALPHLGDTVTELTQTTPRTFTWTRSSALGLDADELIALLEWVEAIPTPVPPPTPPAKATAAAAIPSPSDDPSREHLNRWPPLEFSPVVIDAKTRQPVKDFQLLVGDSQHPATGPDSFQWSPTEILPGLSPSSTPTVRVDWPQYWNGVRFAVVAAGDLVAESPVWTRGGATSWVFELQPRSGRRGRVLGHDGAPVPAVIVVDRKCVARPRSPTDPAIAPLEDPGYITVVANDQGAFELPPLLAGTRVHALHGDAGYGGSGSVAGNEDLEIRLAAWGRIEGVLHLDGRPAPWVRIELDDPIWGLSSGSTTTPVPFHVITDARGHFVLPKVPAGTHHLRWTRPTPRETPDRDLEALRALQIPPGSLFDQAIRDRWAAAPWSSGFLPAITVRAGTTARLPETSPIPDLTGTVEADTNAVPIPDLQTLLGRLQPADNGSSRAKPFSSDLERREWFAELAVAGGERAALRVGWTFRPDPAGNFHIANVPEGTYLLTFEGPVGGHEGRMLAARTVSVPRAPGNLHSPPIHLGRIPVRDLRQAALRQ